MRDFGARTAAVPVPAARRARLRWGIVLVALMLAAALVPAVLSDYAQDLITRILIYAVFALSLELLVGTTGLISLGHAAYFGIAAYVTARLTPDTGQGAVLLMLPLAMLGAGLFALAVGALSLRTKGVYFIMVTLAFGQMAYFVAHDTPLGGGSDGLYLDSRPAIVAAGRALVRLDVPGHLYWFCLASLVGTYGLLALLRRSRFGHALAGIRINEQRMRAAGYHTYRYKLAAFVIAGMLAGLAGFLIAVRSASVNPELLSWHESGGVLLMVILGGLGSLPGAVLGAAAFILLKELYGSEAVFGSLAAHWQLTLGVTMILLVAFRPDGLVGIGRRQRSRDVGAVADLGASVALSTLAPHEDIAMRTPLPQFAPLLRATALERHFGGLAAVDAVSIDLRPGEIHAVIGTNGAGKSTLINMLSGELAPSSGTIAFADTDIGAWSQPRRARAGIGRSYQRTTIFPELSVFENCRLCAQAAQQQSWALWASAAACRRSNAVAAEVLAVVGLAAAADKVAGSMSHGQKRQLEIAMCLATGPRVLLLDEPLAGMGAEESQRMLALLMRLKTSHAILLVEHDMDAVFQVADRITVMVNGQVIACGMPQAIRADPEVQHAYLGAPDSMRKTDQDPDGAHAAT